MSKVRIHQIAKDFDRPAKEIIAVLEKLGVEGKHHTSSIEEEWIPKIRKYLQPYAKRETVKVERPTPEELAEEEVITPPPPVAEAPRAAEASRWERQR